MNIKLIKISVLKCDEDTARCSLAGQFDFKKRGKRAWYLRCSVSLSFVDEEVYHVMYRYMITLRHITIMTSLQMTSALSDIQILSWMRACHSSVLRYLPQVHWTQCLLRSGRKWLDDKSILVQDVEQIKNV